MMSRVIETSIGLSCALAHDGQLDLGVDRAAHLLDRLVEGQALHLLAVELGDDVVRQDAGLGGGRVVDRRDDLDEAVFHRDLDAEAAELAARLHLHVAEALRVHVARMRIEPVEHAVDRLLDELGVIRLLHVVGAHALEHVAEQIELPVGVGRRRLGACAEERKGARLGGCERDGHTGRRAEENQGSLAYHPRTFSLSVGPPWARIDGRPVFSKLDIEDWLARTGCHSRGRLRSATHHRNGFSGQHKLAEIHRNPLHPRKQHMIPAACIQDQELSVGPERSRIDNPAIAGGGHLRAGPACQR